MTRNHAKVKSGGYGNTYLTVLRSKKMMVIIFTGLLKTFFTRHYHFAVYILHQKAVITVALSILSHKKQPF